MTHRIVRLIVVFASAMLAWASCFGTVEQWDVHEIEFRAKQSYKNPFRDVVLTAEFIHPASGTKLTVPGFHDGDGAGGQEGNVWKIRFMPTLVGTWNWTSSSTPHDEGLAGKSGFPQASPSGRGNHGPISKAGPRTCTCRTPTGITRFWLKRGLFPCISLSQSESGFTITSRETP